MKTREEIEEAVNDQNRFCAIFEYSALTTEGVDEAFQEAIMLGNLHQTRQSNEIKKKILPRQDNSCCTIL